MGSDSTVEGSTPVAQVRHTREDFEMAEETLLRAAIKAGNVEQFTACQVVFDYHAELANGLLGALREIAAMPAYSMPVAEHYVSSLIKRYHRALTLAEDAVAKATGAS